MKSNNELKFKKSSTGRMLDILNSLNESVDLSDDDKETKTCDQCGVEYEGESCPQCGKITESEDDGVLDLDQKEDPKSDPESRRPAEVAEEDSVSESKKYRLSRVLTEYYKLCEEEEFDKAKDLKEEEDVDILINKDGGYEIKESDEDKENKIVLTKEDLEDMAKVDDEFDKKDVEPKANVNESRAYRRKSMKAKARRQLSESYRKTRIINAVQKLAMKEGFSFSSKKLSRAINEAYRINEDEIEAPEDKIETALTDEFEKEGVSVKDCDIETNDGVVTAHLTLEDSDDSNVFLGDVADNVEDKIDGFDVDYDDPEINESDDDTPDEVKVDFHFVPVLTTESDDLDDDKDEDELDESDDQDEDKKDDVEECDNSGPKKKLQESDDKDEEEEDGSIVVDELDDKKEDVFESFAGGSKNVRCRINPAFIKEGQVIFDQNSKTVFKAMSESVSNKRGYGLTIQVYNSADSKLARLSEGVDVILSSKGNYFLLRENPVK